MDVSDRRMQVQLTQEARIASDFSYIRAILAVVGFVSALNGAPETGAPFFCPQLPHSMLISLNIFNMSSICTACFSSPALSSTMPPWCIISRRSPYSRA